MILVTGASGFTGLAVLRALAGQGAAARALIRDTAKANLVREAGAVEVRLGDLRKIDSVRDALAGCTGVYLIGPRFMAEEAEVAKAVIDLATEAGVRRLVYSGVYHPSIRPLLNHRVKLVVEDHLYRSDLEFTVLQPARYMHGPLLSSWRGILERGVYSDAFDPDRAMAYVDYHDVAEVAAIALTETRLIRGTFELAASGEHTGHDVAAALSRVLGRPVRAERAQLADYGPARGPAMANPYALEGFQRLRSYYDAYGFRGGNGLVLETILGRAASDVETCMRRLLAERAG